MSTNTNDKTNNASDSEIEQRVAYNEYTLECAAAGTKPKTFHQWANAGKMFSNAELAKLNGSAAPVVKAGSTEVPKTTLARRVFARHAATGTLVRKNIINEFQSEAGCTPAGANTYYANIMAEYKKDHVGFMAKYYVVPTAETTEESTSVDLKEGLVSEDHSVDPNLDLDAGFDTSDFDSVEDNDQEEAA
ncbi:MAG: hypothetical protein EO766_17630 [Hydrotalea sp. AMD]|uniref:hypothetical protein n=1 Tax=Hydrotalea sp. AMD TaxID=2501297 RepID=UPI001026B295|nr:hypothetical protein [Hydrotalea sp. AMD]RWZ83506.1 MAG: hypothetical protein EO766_17630 [Hydrotalea sp. AMD]